MPLRGLIVIRKSPMKPSTIAMKSTGFARSQRIEAREVSKLAQKVPAVEVKRRMRKCAVQTCRKLFAPRSMTHKTCGPECAQEFVRLEKARTDRRERQAGLTKLKQEKKSYWIKLAQTAFNAYRREVCRLAGYGCICCNAPLDWVTPNKVDAGHYLSRGASPHLKPTFWL